MSHWQVIRCTSGSEIAALARLARLGYSGGWFPQKQVNALSGAKKRVLRQAKRRGAVSQPKPAKKQVPWIPGYVFVPCEVEIERVRSHPESKLWMAALVVNGSTVSISDDDMCSMREIPDRLKARLEEFEAQIRAEREARRPVVGGKAVVVDGAFAGHDGCVKSIEPAGVKIDVGGLIGYITAPLDMVERVA